MEITVKFLGPQILQTRLIKYDIQCAEDACVMDVMGFLRLRFPKIEFGEIILVNNIKKDIQTRLKHKDEISFVPTIGGG